MGLCRNPLFDWKFDKNHIQVSQASGFSVGNNDFQKGGDKKSEGLGLRTGIEKAEKKREDRIKAAINSGAKELIAQFKLVESVLDQVDKGGHTVCVVLPTDTEGNSGYSRRDAYVMHGAIESDKIRWLDIFSKMVKMMHDEGVTMKFEEVAFHTIRPNFHKYCVRDITLSWDPHD